MTTENGTNRCPRCGSSACIGLSIPAGDAATEIKGFQLGGETFVLEKPVSAVPGQSTQVSACMLIPSERERLERMVKETHPGARLA